MTNSINIGIELYTKELCKHGLILGSTGSGKSTTLLSIIEGLYTIESLPNLQIVFDVKGDLNKIKECYQNDDILLYEINKNWNADFNCGTPLKMKLGNLPLEIFIKLLCLSQSQENILNTLMTIVEWDAFANPNDLIKYLYHYKNDMSNIIDINNVSFEALITKLTGFKIKYNDYFLNVEKHDYINYIDYLGNVNKKCNVIIVINVSHIQDDSVLYSLFTAYVVAMIKKTYTKEVKDLQCSVYIDEAHTLFKDSLEFMTGYFNTFIKMIRSKGVSCWFVSQGFNDIPTDISDNVNTLIQHKLKINGGEGKSVQNIARMFNMVNLNFDINFTVKNYSGAIVSLNAGDAFISTTDNNTKQLPIELVSINAPYCIESEVVTNGFSYNICPIVKYCDNND